MTKARQPIHNVCFHPMFTSHDCTFSDGINGVIFSPATSETLLCECSALDYIHTIESYFSHHTTLPAANLALNDEQSIIIEKLLNMRILITSDNVSTITFDNKHENNLTNFSVLDEE